MAAAWTEDEDRVLRLYYGKHGPTWPGWKYHLPHRSTSSISEHARRMGLQRKREGRCVLTNREALAMACLREGKSPSQIDEERAWPAGAARRAIVSAWAKGAGK